MRRANELNGHISCQRKWIVESLLLWKRRAAISYRNLSKLGRGYFLSSPWDAFLSQQASRVLSQIQLVYFSTVGKYKLKIILEGICIQIIFGAFITYYAVFNAF